MWANKVAGHFAERHFTERHFAELTFCRVLPTDGQLAVIDISSELKSFAYTVNVSVIKAIVDFDSDRKFTEISR